MFRFLHATLLVLFLPRKVDKEKVATIIAQALKKKEDEADASSDNQSHTSSSLQQQSALRLPAATNDANEESVVGGDGELD